MSTTVIASALGARLTWLPAVPATVDVAAVKRVLQRHGVTWVPDPRVRTAPEFIAAQGLDPVAAAALASDLQDIGLTVRIASGDDITRSRRVGGALSAQMMVALAGIAGLAMGSIPLLDAMKDGAPVGLWIALMVLPALALAYALVNIVALNQRGGNQLVLAGTVAAPSIRAAAQELRELVEVLPSHHADALMNRVAALQQRAAQDPTGPAAAELRALVADLRQSNQEPLRREATALREDIERARRAVAETESG